MKIKIEYTTDIPDWWRREINRWYGKPGLATRTEIIEWLKAYGTSMDDDLSRISMGLRRRGDDD